MTRMTEGQKQATQLIADVEQFVGRYVTFSDAQYSLPLALWTAATFLWQDFDAFPYLVITSETKRSGKTRLSELLSFVCCNPFNFAAASPATIFRMIEDEQPTLFFDEAEELSSEGASTMRTVLNVGYRRGQTIPRMGKNGIQQFPAYCPKVFILIGDVGDTLRDRSINIRMVRGEPRERFLYSIAQQEGDELRQRMADFVRDRKDAVGAAYLGSKGLPFLGDRDAEIWQPIFALCEVLVPHRIVELQRAATDMAAEKTSMARKFSATAMREAERAATELEYTERLARDLLAVIDGMKAIWSADAVTKLLDLPTGPWRKYRGEGLTAHKMADMLKQVGVLPRWVRKPGSKVQRGYRRDDVAAAVKRMDTKKD